MRERAEHADDAAEAVKQRHAQAQAIGRRVAEPLRRARTPLLTMFRLDSITPLGKPVVPDVYCMLITSSTPTAADRDASAASGIWPAIAREALRSVRKPSGACPESPSTKIKRRRPGMLPLLAPISSSAPT